MGHIIEYKKYKLRITRLPSTRLRRHTQYILLIYNIDVLLYFYEPSNSFFKYNN
jgi:hypothetical protein